MRERAMMDYFRAYKILVNGKQVGTVKNGMDFKLEVTPGNYLIQLQIDWCYSNSVEIEINNENVILKCGNNFKGKGVFKGVFNVLGAKGDYLWLKANDLEAIAAVHS